MIDPDEDTKLILDRLEREGHLVMTSDGKHFKVTSEKYAFLKKIQSEGPYPYFCIFLSGEPANISEADLAWARSVAERVLEEQML